MIANIAIEKLSTHPHNPRKDLGDLSEIVESIKAQGVLQNLTVVPSRGSRCSSCVSLIGANGNCKKGYQDELSKLMHLPENEDKEVLCPEWEWKERYTVVIGHRRLAAAKLAGLAELPCAIIEMDERTQIATMLLENMQRNDLTVYEQAQGFQMMLDLGETMQDISEKTGFSATTVRRRINLLELDADKFKKADARGATIMDYAELEKIKDITRRNEVLDKIGTKNFQNELQSALDAEKLETLMQSWENDLSVFATKIEKNGFVGEESVPMEYKGNYGWWEKTKEVVRPEDADTVRYFYRVGDRQIDLYCDVQEHQETDEERIHNELKAASQQKEATLSEISERHSALRMAFFNRFSAVKKFRAEICKFAIHTFFVEKNYNRNRILASMLGLSSDGKLEDCEVKTLALESCAKQPEYALLSCAYATLASSDNYWISRWSTEKRLYEHIHRSNEKLDCIYDFLISIGYEMSDEEEAMRNGTHELLDVIEPEKDIAEGKE